MNKKKILKGPPLRAAVGSESTASVLSRAYSHEPPVRRDSYGGVVGEQLYMWGGNPNFGQSESVVIIQS